MKHLISIPLFDKNIKSIYRSKSSERLITFFSLFALCLIVNKIFIVYDPYSLSNRICWFMGESIFLSVFGIQAIITIIAGFITGGAVFSSEREQLTYDILMTSPLSKKTIIDTSLLSTIMPFITIMFISLPLFAIAYFLGGVSVKVISELIIMNFAALLVFTMFGMSFSVSSKKTFNATLIVIFFSVSLLFITYNKVLGIINPIYIASVIKMESDINLYQFSISPIAGFIILYFFLFLSLRFRSAELMKKEADRNFSVSRIWFFIFIALFEFYLFGIALSGLLENERDIANKVFMIYTFTIFFLTILISGNTISFSDKNIKSNIKKSELNFFNRLFFKRDRTICITVFSMIFFTAIILIFCNILIFGRIFFISQFIKLTALFSIFLLMLLKIGERIGNINLRFLKINIVKLILYFIVVFLFLILPAIINNYNLINNNAEKIALKSDYLLLLSPMTPLDNIISFDNKFKSEALNQFSKIVSPYLFQVFLYGVLSVVLHLKIRRHNKRAGAN